MDGDKTVHLCGQYGFILQDCLFIALQKSYMIIKKMRKSAYTWILWMI